MLSTQSLREHMDRYADGSLSSESLEEWLASESWDMRRWASEGLQHLVEALQVAFIDHSEGKLSAEELDAFLRERCLQLHRAAEVSRPLEESIRRQGADNKSVAVNQALTTLDSVLANA